jgi:hypothetical protein
MLPGVLTPLVSRSLPDSFTRLLLHFDGADAATYFRDHSASAHAVTSNGDAQIDVAQSKFGSVSGSFDGTGDYLTAADSSDWDFGTGAFTIEFWFAGTGTRP